jgi:beta-galactosidase beta subunit
MSKLNKIQSQTGYFHAAVETKDKDANVMPDSDQIYYASETTHTTQNLHKNPTTHLQYNS